MAVSKPAKGSAEAKKAYYHEQRLKADRTGDTKTSTKIYDKLNAAQYGKSAPGAANFRAKKAEYDANEATRPKDKMPAKKKTGLGGHRGT
jgi:hypothetical protein